MFGMQPHAFYSSEHQSDLLRKASLVLKVFFSPSLPFFFSCFPIPNFCLFSFSSDTLWHVQFLLKKLTYSCKYRDLPGFSLLAIE